MVFTILILFHFFYILQITIDVIDKNDCAPVFIAEQLKFSVTEDAQIGRVIGTINATDIDTIGNIIYKIINGDQDKFVVDSKSGELKLINTLDRELKEEHEVKVQATDGIHYTNATVYVTVSLIFINIFSSFNYYYF